MDLKQAFSDEARYRLWVNTVVRQEVLRRAAWNRYAARHPVRAVIRRQYARFRGWLRRELSRWNGSSN